MGARSGTGGYLLQVVPHHVEVVSFLHDGAERVLRHLRVQPGRSGTAEQVERAGPVDRLGDARRFGQVKLTQPIDGGDHLAGEGFGYARLLDVHDLLLTVGGWGVDTVVAAAAPQP